MIRKNKRILLGILSIILIILFSYVFINKPINKIDGFESKNAYVYNLTNNKTELDINGDEKVYPASLTKIMTVLVSLDGIDDLSTIAPIDVETYKNMVESNSSMAGFYGYEQTSYRDLLYGTILVSGGECANSLAINISGSTEEFTELMNKKVKEIGLRKTKFKNPEGLDEEGQYSTAKDIALLLKFALKNEDFRSVFTAEEYISSKTLDHPNGLYIESNILSRLNGYPEESFKIIGGKSGTTDMAGNCWATLVEKDGKEYICVVMGGSTDESRILDTLRIMKII